MRTAAALVLCAAGLALLPAAPAAAGGGGGCHLPGVTDDATNEVSLTGLCFTPTVARVDVGDTVTFRNNDPMTHMVTGAGGSFGDHTEIASTESVTHRFAEAGVFPYYCLLHPAMVGAVVVGDGAPAVAGTATGGSDGGGNVAGVAAGAGAVVTLAGLAAARRRWTRSIVPSPGA